MGNGGYTCMGCDARGHVNQLCDHLGIPHIVTDDVPERLGSDQWLETTYTYKDGRGQPFGVVDLYRQADGGKKPLPKRHGAERYGLGKDPWPLYRSEELAKSKLNVVWFVEGEKCVEALRAIGLVAVTNQGGSKAFSRVCPQSLSLLDGKTVVIIPDNDDPGEALALQVEAEAKRRKCSVSILRLPGLENDGDDVYDWLKAGGDVDQLVALAESEVKRSKDAATFIRRLRQYANEVEAGTSSLEAARGAVMSSVAQLGSVSTPNTMTAEEAFLELARRIETGDQDSGWWWQVDRLDHLAGKIRRKKLIALAGDSGSGKSAFALQAADGVANTGSAVRVYSQEMEAVENVERIAARLLRRAVKTITADDARRFAAAYKAIPISIHDRRVDLEFLLSDIRLWANTTPDPGMVVLDFVQLMTRARHQTEAELVHEVAYAMKDLAKELNISILLLGQLTLAARRAGDRLKKSDVRGGGSLADASDQFFLLEADGEADNDGQRDVIVRLDKFRAGAVGEIVMEFSGPTFEFRDKIAAKLIDKRDAGNYIEWTETYENL